MTTILEDINEIVDYLWEDEKQHYLSLDDRERQGHVFERLRRIRTGLETGRIAQ